MNLYLYIMPFQPRTNLMKNKAVKLGLIATIAPHIFCCGLPMVLAMIGSVGTLAAYGILLGNPTTAFRAL